MKSLSYTRWFVPVACALFVGGVIPALSALACDTPVYRYAMYRWDPAPYEVYYFHNEAISEDAARLHKLLEDASMNEEKPANVMFVPVNLVEDTELKRIPPDVRQTWQEQEEPTVPAYMVVTPYGHKIYQGDLDETAIKALLESKARSAVAKQLEQGKATVLLMLTGSDDEKNKEAEKVAKELVKDIAEGKVEFYLPPPMYDPTGEAEDSTPGIEIGFCRVDRNDANEKWLIDSLLSMESDLRDEEFVDKPMIFGVFGRGRALPPFIGKGINRDNLLDCVDFVSGACSCTVKDQNPGMDLLFSFDWYTAAENLANVYGGEEGGEAQFGAEDFFPNLMIPPTEEGAEEAATDETTDEATDTQGDAGAEEVVAEPESGDTTLTSTTQIEQPAEESPEETTSAETEAEDGPAGDETTGDETAVVQQDSASPVEEEPVSQPEEETEVASREPATSDSSSTAEVEASPFFSVFTVGAGVGIALVLLFGATFLVLRPR